MQFGEKTEGSGRQETRVGTKTGELPQGFARGGQPAADRGAADAENFGGLRHLDPLQVIEPDGFPLAWRQKADGVGGKPPVAFTRGRVVTVAAVGFGRDLVRVGQVRVPGPLGEKRFILPVFTMRSSP